MTGQVENAAYDVSKNTELHYAKDHQSTSVFGWMVSFVVRHRSLVLSLSSVLSVLVIWYLITALNIVPSLFLPSPQAVWQKFLEVSQQGFMQATLWQHLAASISRVLLALVAAIAIGVPLGLWMGQNKWVRAVFDPLVELLRPIPPLAYLPLLVIWFGIGETTKVLLIFFSILAPVIISSTHGVLSHQLNRERAALSLGASQSQVFWHVILPTALPHILTGIRIGLGVGWSTLVASELVAADRGIGFMVQSAAQFLITDTVVLGIIVIAIVAVSFELFLRWLQQQLSPWYGQQL